MDSSSKSTGSQFLSKRNAIFAIILAALLLLAVGVLIIRKKRDRNGLR